MGDILSYSINDDFIYKEIGNNYVAVDINTAKYYTFNDTAAFFLKCFADKKDQLQIKAAFLAEFDVHEETYLEGLNLFVKDAASKGILIPINKEET
ncbi:MAG: PqqD family protein [Deltaproteobacteria bacterium]|nr:PqqD family protein [Deltaproteobacteria bacterium]